MYRLNDGTAYIYNVLDEVSKGGKPLKPIEGAGTKYFEYIGISAADYNTAMQDEVRLETRIRILQDKRISTQNVIRINDLYYKIWRVRHAISKTNIPITDITLLAALERFEVVL